ncbi:MAG: acyl-ACP--UDP-N-acetylglucosamine O-acyltransferase [Planctomycetota bacterium]|jgi:UDP-N-acetylglucosamine acyltransferase
MSIHPTAIVNPEARLGEGAEVGPYAVIGAGVVVGDRCRIGPHACLTGPLEIGEDCVVCFSAALGHDPQAKDSPGPFGGARIGPRNIFREFSQVHRSMLPGEETLVGSDGFFMANSHIAHDCVVGDQVVMCNNAILSGHVVVQDRVFLSGNTCFQQFARLGELCFVAGGSAIPQDVPPFTMVAGMRPARLQGLNVVGLRRAGISGKARRALKEAYRNLFRSNDLLEDRLREIDCSMPEVDRLVKFVMESERGVIGFGGRAQDG